MQQKNKISKQTITRKTKATSTLMQETKKQLTLVAGSGQTSHKHTDKSNKQVMPSIIDGV